MKQILYCALFVVVSGWTFQTIAAQDLKDPIKEAARKREKQYKEQNYKELKDASAELLTLSKDLDEEVNKSGEQVISARIFEKLDKIDKLTKRIRGRARGPY